jgi:multiple sugar transport system permease protein
MLVLQGFCAVWFFYEIGNAGAVPVSLSQVIISAGTLLVIGPILLIYLFAQRGFVESVSKSGIKG